MELGVSCMSDDQKSLELFGRGEAVEDIASPLLAYQMADIFNDRRLSDIFKDRDGLVQVLEAGEPGSISFVIRAVYDGDDLDKFMERLDSRIKNHDKEIERMCNHHYQGFIDSVRELLQVSNDAAKLKDEIKTTNDALQKSCAPLLERGEELIHCRKIQKNIASAIESLSLCLPVLEMYGKLKEQMKSKRYYPALKTLEQLEHTFLPRVNTHWFSQTMADAIPKLRESIKDASMSDLKDFLENIRKHSARIGEVAMRHAAEQNNIDPSIVKQKRRRRAPPPPNPFTGEIPQVQEESEEEQLDEELSAQDLIDFSPVYRCLHIYSVLGARETFETYYRKQRRKQARLSLKPSQNMYESLDSYKLYFHDVVGFFVVEDHILNTTSGLVNQAYMDELWEMAVSKIAAELRRNCGYCNSENIMLEIKNLILLFCHTLRGYGFSVGHLLELLLEIRDQYNEMLMTKWAAIFDRIFSDDNYTPMYIENEKDFQTIMGDFPLSEQLTANDFPKQFPFSQFVPKIYHEVKEYINACLKFSSDLHLSHTEIDDMIRKSTNQLLTRTLSGCLSTLIKKPSLSLLQLIQISINMNNLEKSCSSLEEYISNITGAEKDSIHVAKLHGTSMFKDARSEAEEYIYKQLNVKIDEFLDLANYDWALMESKGHASGYLMDLIAFLQSTFMSFTNLPEKVARTACMSACKHIACSLMDFVMDNDVKQVTMGALQQFNLDLIQCEQFAASDPVSGFNDGTLLLAFADLRQLLDLLLNWDWSVYLADYGQPKCKYVRVKPVVAISLLEKLNSGDKKKFMFTPLKKNERDKKKLLDTVLKQLKGLVNGTAPQQGSGQ
ncbi:exocyst complex component 6B-like isoform X1 [Octopus vulgaris]|uniref:Exocyst complex component 6B-like isoform X1 n=4 Tax=Octopus TaxID=6643 RepID=A0AA36FBM7_OCTVU|nr:exocyst complex component 6B isoform X1 [Octopus sinensis]CAI9733086.1 exocyst complex component 6B-like isoform X1 [Octopus vulgaris]